jgi:hypothetical protein
LEVAQAASSPPADDGDARSPSSSSYILHCTLAAQIGNWADISGETFLRKLLSMAPEESRPSNKESMYDCTVAITVDPRSLAQRIMDVSHRSRQLGA